MVYDLVSKTAERQKHPGQPMTPMSDWILFGFFAICAAWVLSKDAFWPGQSFGKRFSRIVIASVKFNAPASRLRCIWRQFIFIAILVALELLGVGLFSERRLAETAPRVFAAIYILLECCLVLVTSEGRRVIDFIAGTQVVNGAELNEKQVT